MASQRQYLEWHGQQWRVRVKVPLELRSLLGKGKITYPLHTADLSAANEQKWAIVAAIKAEFTKAKKAKASEDPLTAEALTYRLQNLKGDPEGGKRLMDRVDEMSAPSGTITDETLAFVEVATGASTPLTFHEDSFMAHKEYRTKSQSDLKRAIRWLEVWLKATRRHPYLEDIDRKVAGQFIDEFLLKNRSRQKAGAYLGFLREYWRWLKHRGHIEENPWVGQELPRAARPRRDREPDGGKRAYSDSEMQKLLYGPASDYLPDLIRVAALSGMRIEEICQLRVLDCQNGQFSVWHGKTDNARRTVPIHPDLKEIVKQRTKEKEPKAFLFGELPDAPKSRDTRSDPASKRFTRYRRDVGVDERPNNKPKSNVDFHSFRRWFIRKARDGMANANGAYSPWTIADVVGHDDEGIKETLALTMVHYPGSASEASKRACVEAVKLPKHPGTT